MSSRRSLRFAQHYIECWYCGTNAEYYCKDCFKKLCKDCRYTHNEETDTNHHLVVSFHEKRDEENKIDEASSGTEENDQDTMSDKEAEGQGSKHKPPYSVSVLKKGSSFRLSSHNCLQHVHLASDSSENLWVSDGENITCVEKDGKIKYNLKCEGDWGCHVETGKGKILYLKGRKIKQYNPIKNKKTFVKYLESSPNCISTCPKSGNIIVGLTKGNPGKEKGAVLSLTKNGDSFWEEQISNVPRYITNDAEGNIYVSCRGNLNGSVLALESDGDCQFTYRGDVEKYGFMPLGICTDKAGLVFVINATQRNIHVIGKDGALVLVLRTENSFLPFGIAVGNEGYIWTCSGDDVIQWRASEDILQWNVSEEVNQWLIPDKKKVYLREKSCLSLHFSISDIRPTLMSQPIPCI